METIELYHTKYKECREKIDAAQELIDRLEERCSSLIQEAASVAVTTQCLPYCYIIGDKSNGWYEGVNSEEEAWEYIRQHELYTRDGECVYGLKLVTTYTREQARDWLAEDW